MLTTVCYERETLTILDQTKLPAQVAYETLDSKEAVFDAIASLKVRGAPLIGVVAAYGVLVGIQAFKQSPDVLTELNRVCSYLGEARPTAVNLTWALNRMRMKAATAEDVSAVYDVLTEEAKRIHAEDTEINRLIGEHAYALIKDRVADNRITLLTHCNAGALATTGYGTATSVMYLLNDLGVEVTVYVCETRPLLQGARLTARELSEAGIETILITDSMAATVLAHRQIDAIFVGADRVAANHDVANKIGTLGLSVLAQQYKVPFYVACPSPTYDPNTRTGGEIFIEERGGAEITVCGGVTLAPEGIKTFNPAFDVTPAEHITAIITEKGPLD